MRRLRAIGLLVVAVVAALLLSWWLSGLSMVPRGDGGKASPEGGARGRYRRVITMSPAVSEIVFALGAGERVVGVSQYTTWPPEAMTKPRCGGFFNPSHEAILSLEPDLLVAQGEAGDLTRFARDNGIELLSLDLTDLESIFRETARVGRVLGLTAEAERVCGELRARLDAVRQRAATRPPVRVLLVTGREPNALRSIATAGAGTFLHDAIEVAGGRNVFADLPSAYGVVNMETLIERAPEVVVELHGEGGDAEALQREVRELWDGLRTLPAVRQGRVYAVAATYALIPGPRVVLLAERLADLLHGEGGR